jgi:hypothetical protein
MNKLAWPLLLTTLLLASHLPGQTKPEPVVEIERINVTGSRCPAQSIIALSGLKPHDKVREIDVNTACHRITASGLFKSIDYTYDAYPDRPGVVLNLEIVDEGGLVPSSIKFAGDETVVWAALQTMDPILTRQMPPTEKAVSFYEKRLQAWLQTSGRDDEYAAGNVVADDKGSPSSIVFEIRKYKFLPSKK